MPENQTISTSDYSMHLFWDVSIDNFDLNKHKELLVSRVLDYGVMADWQQLVRDLGLEQIKTITLNLRDLEPRAATFIAALTDIKIELFRCYTTQQSNPKHWHF
ncbi:MAG: hypothetical protein JJU28_18060 [Cyclobacteriaceae bacterium]|nr:hypothetical protein [Cyclobacteriaceae bacterium]